MALDEIILNPEKIDALSSKSRREILKLLKGRRMTLSEISEELNLSVSTVHDHMTKLTESGLVNLDDDGRKWKYYSLTRETRKILDGGSSHNVIFVFSAILMFSAAIYSFAVFIRGYEPKAAASYTMHDPIFFFAGELLLFAAVYLGYITLRRRGYAKYVINAEYAGYDITD